jgi:hypothetical protein
MPYIPLPNLGLGLNFETAPGDMAPGYWNNCANFRFFNDYASSFEGARALPNGGTTTVPYRFIMPYGRPVASGSERTTKYMIGAGVARVFVNNGTAESEITRYTEGVTIASITFVGTTATVTTTTAHGRSTGNLVDHWGALPAPYNANGASITVTGATTYTYTMASVPATNATSVGLYSYNVTSNFTGGVADNWTGGNLNGIGILGNPIAGVYYWNDPANRMRKVPGSETFVAYATRTFKNYIFLLAPTYGGTAYPYQIRWSNSAEPGAIPTTFTPANGNDANFQDLAETPGALVDCMPLGELLAVYKEDSIYVGQYTGSNNAGDLRNNIFDFKRIPGTDGLFGRNCVADTPRGHVFLAKNRDVRLFDGVNTVSVAEGRVKQYLQAFMDKAKDSSAFVVSHPTYSEVWICFSDNLNSNPNDACNRVLVWNWKYDTWGMFEFIASGWPMLTAAANGEWPSSFTSAQTFYHSRLLVGTHDSKAGMVDGADSYKYFGNSTYAWLRRDGITLGKGTEGRSFSIRRSRWHVIPVNESISITVAHGSKDIFGQSPTYPGDYVTFDYVVGSTKWADRIAPSSEYGSIYLYFNSTRQQSLRSGMLDVSIDGSQ